MITPHDIFLVFFLAFLEGVLSLDNALVLALLAGALPPKEQKRALLYGLWGAVLFRFIALSLITQLMQWHWVKVVGGLYLVILAIRSLISSGRGGGKKQKSASPNFWKTVVLIELMDIVFAVDSILAAAALTQKLWVVFVGGIIGVVMMRFVSSTFIGLLKKFERLEHSAFWLILWIGLKLLIEAADFDTINFHETAHPEFWIFWGLMALTFTLGFWRKRA